MLPPQRKRTKVSPSTSNGRSGSSDLVIADAFAPPSAPVKDCMLTRACCLGRRTPMWKSAWPDEAPRPADAAAQAAQAARRERGARCIVEVC